MSYTSTFITVSADCPVHRSEIPISSREPKPAHLLQYELLQAHPYQFGHEDLIYEVHIRQKGFSPEQLRREAATIRQELFSKGHPCMRASSLTKRYGFGAHYNAGGKIAIYPLESDEYRAFMQDDAVKKIPAMRNKKK